MTAMAKVHTAAMEMQMGPFHRNGDPTTARIGVKETAAVPIK
jgi:hypothetical protein